MNAPAARPTMQFCPVCAAALVLRADPVAEGGRQRQACPQGHWTFWDNPLPVLAAVVEFEGRILLARNAAWPETAYALITGFMERDETPEQGIARELKEETNLEAGAIKLIGVYEFMRKNELIIAYHVQASGEIRLSEELADYRLVAPADLRPWPGGTGAALADWLRSENHAVVLLDRPLFSAAPAAVEPDAGA